MEPQGNLYVLLALSIVCAFIVTGTSAAVQAMPSYDSVGKATLGALQTVAIMSGRPHNPTDGSATVSIAAAPHTSGTSPYVVYTLDLCNNTLISGNFLTGCSGLSPWGIVFDESNAELYISNFDGSDVWVVSGNTQKIADTISVGTHPVGIAYDSESDYIYVSNDGSSNVSVINDGTNDVVASIPVGAHPEQLAYDDGGEIFVASYSSNNVSVISDSTNSVVSSINVGSEPFGVASDGGRRIFVTNGGSNNASDILESSNSVEASIPVGPNPWGDAFDVQLLHLFVANDNRGGQGNVSVIDETNDKAVASINVGSAPEGIAYDYATSEMYVANTASNNVSVINDSTDEVTSTFSVGSGPSFPAYDEQNGYVYVGNSDQGTVSIIAQPIIIKSFTASHSPTDVGLKTYLNTSVSGGTTVNKYTYTGLPAGCSSSDTASLACTPTASGTFKVEVYVNDSAGIEFATDNISLIVHDGPSISSFSNARNPTDVNVTDWLNVTASGGSGSLSKKYTGLPPGCNSANTSSLSCTPTKAGTYSVEVFVNDSLRSSTSATIVFKVNVDTTITSFLTSSPLNTTDVGIPITLRVSASGGSPSPSYHYNYTGLPTGCTTADSPSLSCDPAINGSFILRVYVNDSATFSAEAALILLVNVDTTITTFVTSSLLNTTDVGIPMTLRVLANGGSSPYHYNYTGLPAGCISSDTNALLCTPSVNGNFSVKVFVNDSAGWSVNESLTLTVNVDTTIVSFSESRNMTDVGVPVELSVSATGGTMPYSYKYAGLPGGCNSSNVSLLTCTPTESGFFNITVFVNDSATGSASRNISLLVNEDTVITSFSASRNQTEAGTITTLIVNEVLGTQPFMFTYTGLPGGCESGNESSLPCTPSATGNFTVRVFVNDTVGFSRNLTLRLHVNSPLSIKSFAVAPNPTDVGVRTRLSVTAIEGIAPYRYVYVGMPLGCQTSNLSLFYCSPATAGIYRVQVYVNDSGGHSVNTTAYLNVSTVLTVELSANRTSLLVGENLTLVMAVQGGVPPCTYQWSINGTNTTYSSDTLTLTLSVAGNYSFVGWVKDSRGYVASSAVLYVSVSTPQPNSDQWWIAAVVVLVVIVASILLLMILLVRRRNSDRRGSSQVPLPPPPVESFLIPPTPPRNYLDGLSVVPDEWDEGAEGSAYGRYKISESDRAKFVEEVNFPGRAATSEASVTASSVAPATAMEVKPKINLDASRPWSFQITPEGIVLEETARPIATSSGTMEAEFEKVEELEPLSKTQSKTMPEPSETVQDAYRVLSSLANKPHSLDGIKQEVPIDDDELLAILAVLTKAKMIARGTTKTGLGVFVLTPLGRKLGRKFLEGVAAKGPLKELPEKVTVEQSKSPAPPPKQAANKPPIVGKFFVRKQAPPAPSSKTETPSESAEPKEAVLPPNKPATPAPQLSKGTHVQLERTIGPERTEENPFGSEIKPEDVNPNVQHIDPRLLQPMEMRVTQDRGQDVRETEVRNDADQKAQELMRRAQEAKKRQQSKYGSQQAEKSKGEDER